MQHTNPSECKCKRVSQPCPQYPAVATFDSIAVPNHRGACVSFPPFLGGSSFDTIRHTSQPIEPLTFNVYPSPFRHSEDQSHRSHWRHIAASRVCHRRFQWRRALPAPVKPFSSGKVEPSHTVVAWRLPPTTSLEDILTGISAETHPRLFSSAKQQDNRFPAQAQGNDWLAACCISQIWVVAVKHLGYLGSCYFLILSG